MSIANLKIRNRLALAVLLPLFGLMALAGLQLSQRWAVQTQMAGLDELAAVVADISALVHDMQRERGASAVFVGSKGAQMATELAAQRRLTDDRRKPFQPALAKLKGTASAEFAAHIDQAAAAVAALDAKRKEIDALSIPAPASNVYFTESIGKLLAVTSEIAKASDHARVTNAISAYVSFMNGKERTGQERATGAAGISVGKFDAANYQRFVGLAAAQQVYFSLFEGNATPDQRAFFKTTVSGRAIDEVDRMRKIAYAGGLAGEMAGADGKSWFEMQTARIDLMKKVEDRIAGDLRALTAEVLAEARHSLAVLAAGMVALVLLSGTIAMFMARSITGPLARITTAMASLAEGDKAVEVPGIGRKDEIGRMATTLQVFKQSAIEMDRMQAEQDAQKKRTEEEKRQAMHALADRFESSVKGVVNAVSSGATEMRASAQSLSATAEETSRKTTAVAAASEQATTNVQTVAAAAEELSASIGEIARQVAQSAAVAGRAVIDAEKTDSTVKGLAETASVLALTKGFPELGGDANLGEWKLNIASGCVPRTGNG